MKKISFFLKNKKFLIKLFVILLVLVGATGSIVLSQEIIEKPTPSIPENVLAELPSPGILPGTFWYFLDIWGESIQEFFTFRAENKALLQAGRSLERIAEINALLEKKGAEAPGLDIAEAKIQRNMIRVNEILERQRARGIEVDQLAKRLETDFDARQKLLEFVLTLEEDRFKNKIKEKRMAIRDARLIDNFERIAELRIEIENIRGQKNRWNARKNNLRAILDIEEERMELKMKIAEREMDVLEDEMETLFDEKERAMEEKTEYQERALEIQEELLEAQLRQAILAGDITLINQIREQLLALENQEEAFDKEKEIAETILEQRKERKRGMIEIRERAMEQIKEVIEKISNVKEEIDEMIVDGIITEIPTAVLRLIEQAEAKLIVAEQAFEEGNYGKAFGQAIATERLVISANRILERKEEEFEKIKEMEEKLQEINEIKRRIERPRVIPPIQRERRVSCQTDQNCLELICPMVIGMDTPLCDPQTGSCFCGYSGLRERFWIGKEEQRKELIRKVKIGEINWAEIPKIIRE